MAYDVTMVQTNGFGINAGITMMGFPGTPFSNLVYSVWMCCPQYSPGAGVDLTPTINYLMVFDPHGGNLSIGTLHVYSGTFTPPPYGIRHHFLLSINAPNTVQLYIDDQPATVTGTWQIPQQFHVANINLTAWNFNGAGTLEGLYPGTADLFLINPPGDAVFDISVLSNRRKFINADLSPVDLGPAGQNPFSVPPQIFLTIPTGSNNASDFLTNRGMTSDVFGVNFEYTPTFQPVGTCTLPNPPVIIEPTGGALAINDVVGVTVGGPPGGTGCQIFLDWSDDRGHTFGTPVPAVLDADGTLTSLQWQRLGYARDRVFRLTWRCPEQTALQGAWIAAEPGES